MESLRRAWVVDLKEPGSSGGEVQSISWTSYHVLLLRAYLSCK